MNVKIIIKCILENKYNYYWLQIIYLLIMYSFKILVLCNQCDIIWLKFEKQRKYLFVKLMYHTFDSLSLCYQWFHYIIQHKIYDCRECSYNDYDCTAVKYGRHSMGLVIPGKDIMSQAARPTITWLTVHVISTRSVTIGWAVGERSHIEWRETKVVVQSVREFQWAGSVSDLDPLASSVTVPFARSRTRQY